MARGVCPVFYEEGFFYSPSIKQKRIIQNKYIYAIDRVHGNDQRYTELFITDVDGKLKKEYMGCQREQIIAPIMPGIYYFFVSRYNIPNYDWVLYKGNCKEIEITDQLDQEVILPWPMCYHGSDGAPEVAKYILGEIQRNSASDKIKEIRDLIDHKGLFDRGEALILWINQVASKRDWDHKPYIRGDKKISYLEDYHLEDFAVLRPSKRGGVPNQKFYHKYKSHDYYYDVWSNIHYGYVGRIGGFTNAELFDGAGAAQLKNDFPNQIDYDKTTILPRKWDTIPDQRTIELGIELFERTRGDTKKLTAQMILDRLDKLGNLGLLKDARVKHICFDDNEFTVD